MPDTQGRTTRLERGASVALRAGERFTSCSKHKKRKKPENGWYVCQACGQAREKKNKLCDPKKVRK